MCSNKACPDAERSIVHRDVNAARNILRAWWALHDAGYEGPPEVNCAEERALRNLALPLHMQRASDRRTPDPPTEAPYYKAPIRRWGGIPHPPRFKFPPFMPLTGRVGELAMRHMADATAATNMRPFGGAPRQASWFTRADVDGS